MASAKKSLTALQQRALENLSKDPEGDLRHAVRAALRTMSKPTKGFNISRVVGHLIHKRLVEQVPDPKGERHIYKLSEKGRAVLPFLATDCRHDETFKTAPVQKIHIGDVVVHVGMPAEGNPYLGESLIGPPRALALARFRAGVEAPFTFWHAPANGGARRLTIVDRGEIDWETSGIETAMRPPADHGGVALSFGMEVQTIGGDDRWHGNEIRLATMEEAKAYASYKFQTWSLVKDTRIVERQLEPNYAWCSAVSGGLVPIKEG